MKMIILFNIINSWTATNKNLTSRIGKYTNFQTFDTYFSSKMLFSKMNIKQSNNFSMTVTLQATKKCIFKTNPPPPPPPKKKPKYRKYQIILLLTFVRVLDC